MTFTLSRILSTATATYGAYAAVQPRHLGRAITSNPVAQADLDVLAQTIAARDLAISGFGVLGRSDTTVTVAMLLRIVLDVSDGLILSARADSDEARNRILGLTLGWAGLNAVALAVDRRRARRRRLVVV
jgi:hypothetical protein